MSYKYSTSILQVSYRCPCLMFSEFQSTVHSAQSTAIPTNSIGHTPLLLREHHPSKRIPDFGSICVWLTFFASAPALTLAPSLSLFIDSISVSIGHAIAIIFLIITIHSSNSNSTFLISASIAITIAVTIAIAITRSCPTVPSNATNQQTMVPHD